MNAYRRKLHQKPETTSKRWETTAGSALEDVARQLKGNYDRAGKIEDLRNRKLANTQTSISFGNAKVDLFLSMIIVIVLLVGPIV